MTSAPASPPASRVLRRLAALLCVVPALVAAQPASRAPEAAPGETPAAVAKDAPPTGRGIDLQFERGGPRLTAASALDWERLLGDTRNIAGPFTLTIATYGGEAGKGAAARTLARRRAEGLRNDAMVRGVPVAAIVLVPSERIGPAHCLAGAPCALPGYGEAELRVRANP